MTRARLLPWVLGAHACTLLALLVFVPLKYVYPSRTETLMVPTLVLGFLWAAQVVLMIWWLPDVPAWLLWSSLIYPVYYFGLSGYLNLVSRPK